MAGPQIQGLPPGAVVEDDSTPTPAAPQQAAAPTSPSSPSFSGLPEGSFVEDVPQGPTGATRADVSGAVNSAMGKSPEEQRFEIQKALGTLDETPDDVEALFDKTGVHGAIVGVLKGMADTGHLTGSVANWMANKVSGGRIPYVVHPDTPEYLKAQGTAEKVGKVAEVPMEFMLGTEVLKGLEALPWAERLTEAGKIASLVQKYPKIAQALHIGLTGLNAGGVASSQVLEQQAKNGEPLNFHEAGKVGGLNALFGGGLEAIGTVAHAAEGLGAVPAAAKTAAKGAQTAVGGALTVEAVKNAVGPRQANETEDQYIDRVVNAAAQGVMGAAGVKEGVTGLAGEAAKVGEARQKAKVAAAPVNEKEMIGKIYQAETPAELKAATEAHRLIDTTGIKTYDDLSKRLQSKISANVNAVDSRLALNTKNFTPGELQVERPVSGGQPIRSRPVQEAIDQLKDLYEKDKDYSELARVKGVENKLNGQGLNLTELNDLAREQGKVLNAFKSSGEIVAAHAKRAAENTRTDIKELVRGFMPDEATKTLDEQTSNLIDAREMSDDMIDKVQKTQNAMRKAGLLEKIVRKAGPGVVAGSVAGPVGAATGGAIDFGLNLLFGKAGQLDPVDMQERLPKLIKQLDDIQDLIRTNPNQAVSQFQKLISSAPALSPGVQKLVSPEQAKTALSRAGTPASQRAITPERTKAALSRAQGALPKAEAGAEPALGSLEAQSRFEEPHMDVTPRGMDTKAVLNHELAHAAVAQKTGFDPVDIVSGEHMAAPSSKDSRTYGMARIDWGSDFNKRPDGTFPLETLQNRLHDVLTTTMAGAAANELYDGIPRKDNTVLESDTKFAHEMLDLLGVPKDDHDFYIDRAFERAKSLLQDDHTTNVINEFSDTRERGLPDSHHYSAGRTLEFLNRLAGEEHGGNAERPTEGDTEHTTGGEAVGEKTVAAGAAATGARAGGAAGGAPGDRGTSRGLAASARVPAERTAGIHDTAIKEGGAVPGGIQEGDPEIDVPNLVLFHDPQTGSTLALPESKVTPENVKSQLEKSRAQFAAAEGKKVGEKEAKITSAKVQGRPEWIQASFEREIQRAKDILRNSDSTAEEKDYADKLLESSRDLQQKPSLAGLAATSKIAYGKPEEFYEAVKGTPGANLEGDKLSIDAVRYQKPEQAGEQAVRTGVFYLPEKASPYGRYYKTGRMGYGGTQKVEQKLTFDNPIIAKGASGGKVPERAYDAIKGKGAYAAMRTDVLNSVLPYTTGFSRAKDAGSFDNLVESVSHVLENYGGDPGLARELVRVSKIGNQLPYAIQEHIVAHAVRDAGHDGIVGYNKIKGQNRLSEVFDLTKDTYPSGLMGLTGLISGIAAAQKQKDTDGR